MVGARDMKHYAKIDGDGKPVAFYHGEGLPRGVPREGKIVEISHDDWFAHIHDDPRRFENGAWVADEKPAESDEARRANNRRKALDGVPLDKLLLLLILGGGPAQALRQRILDRMAEHGLGVGDL